MSKNSNTSNSGLDRLFVVMGRELSIRQMLIWGLAPLALLIGLVILGFVYS